MGAAETRQFTRISTAELQQRISRIYDHLYANARTRTPHGICKEVGKILHTAMFIEESTGKCPAFVFTLSEIKGMAGGNSDLVRSIGVEVHRRFREMNSAWHLYGKRATIELSDFDLAYTCSQLSGIVVSDRDHDVFGDALEIFRCQWAKRVGGQFFTDPRVTNLAMQLLGFDPRKGDDLIDICAGTGGFLLAGINHIRYLLENEDGGEAIEARLVALATSSLRGQDVDEELCRIANATLESRLSTADHPFVSEGDSLAPDPFGSETSLGLRLAAHLCAATNPPFGTKITVKDPKILRHFDLARVRSNRGGLAVAERLTPRPPDILFLERNVQMLRPGEGRLAIVLPYQILSGPQTLYIREWLLRHAQVQAIIDLPGETFQPHTGTKTCLVVVKRWKRPLDTPRKVKEHPVFMSMPRWIGHDRRGNPIYQRSADGRLTDEILTDFLQVGEAYRVFKQGGNPSAVHENSFAISSLEMTGDSMLRLNALFHRPSENREVNLRQNVKKSGWRRVRLEEVVKRIFYPGRFKRNYVDYFPGAVPFLGGSNITQLIDATDKWLRPDDPKLEELRVYAGWILVTRSGSTGIISSVPLAWDGFAMSEHVIRIVPDPGKLDPAYLLAFLRTRYCQEILSRGVFGSVIDEITPEFIGDIEVPVPTSGGVIKRIAAQVRRAERSRNDAIVTLFSSVEELNEKFAGA